MSKNLKEAGGSSAAGSAPAQNPEQNEPKSKKRFLLSFALVVVFVLGFGIMLYPTFSNWINSLEQSRAIVGYSDNVDSMQEEIKQQQWDAAVEYNNFIYENGQPFEMTDDERIEYNSQLSFDGSGIMGYLDIPSIKVSLPIYHGTSEGVLQVGVGHLEGSSLPVGGVNTNCVLSGHRGLPSAKLLTDLDDMVVGDRFTISILGHELLYEVFEVVTVTQEESDPLYITEGEDRCTLVTCTPYGINSHRLLVMGRRIESDAE